MWSCAAVQLLNSTYRWISKHSSWFLFTIGTESHGTDPSQNPGGCANNAHWSHKIFLRCCRWRTVFLHTQRCSRWNRRTSPTAKTTFSGKAAEWVVNQEPSSMKPSIKEFTKIDGNATSYSLHRIKANTRIRVEQNADLVLLNLKLKIFGQPHDDVLLTTDRRYNHYKEMRIALSSRMDSYSGITTEKLVALNTTKFSYQSS